MKVLCVLLLFTCLVIIGESANSCITDELCKKIAGPYCFCMKDPMSTSYIGTCACMDSPVLKPGCNTDGDCKGKGTPIQYCACVKDDPRQLQGDCKCYNPLIDCDSDDDCKGQGTPIQYCACVKEDQRQLQGSCKCYNPLYR